MYQGASQNYSVRQSFDSLSLSLSPSVCLSVCQSVRLSLSLRLTLDDVRVLSAKLWSFDHAVRSSAYKATVDLRFGYHLE